MAKREKYIQKSSLDAKLINIQRRPPAAQTIPVDLKALATELTIIITPFIVDLSLNTGTLYHIIL